MDVHLLGQAFLERKTEEVLRFGSEKVFFFIVSFAAKLTCISYIGNKKTLMFQQLCSVIHKLITKMKTRRLLLDIKTFRYKTFRAKGFVASRNTTRMF